VCFNFNSTKFCVTWKKLDRIHWKNVLTEDSKKYNMKGMHRKNYKEMERFCFLIAISGP